MLYGILSDIHANLEAFEAVIRFLESKKIDRYLCMGDIVGYGPDPNECVRLMRNLAPITLVVGNHDRAACGLKDLSWFNEYARKAIQWTTRELTQENQIYLSELPKTARHNSVHLVHGSPRDPLNEYFLGREQFSENLSLLPGPLTLVGHTHVPCVFTKTATQVLRNNDRVTLAAGEKYVISAGAVGQPRDGNPRAACATFDSETNDFVLYRLEYDFAKTQEKMRAARLPAFLVQRLAWGK